MTSVDIIGEDVLYCNDYGDFIEDGNGNGLAEG